jgi:hypothetical protein
VSTREVLLFSARERERSKALHCSIVSLVAGSDTYTHATREVAVPLHRGRTHTHTHKSQKPRVSATAGVLHWYSFERARKWRYIILVGSLLIAGVERQDVSQALYEFGDFIGVTTAKTKAHDTLVAGELWCGKQKSEGSK